MAVFGGRIIHEIGDVSQRDGAPDRRESGQRGYVDLNQTDPQIPATMKAFLSEGAAALDRRGRQ